MLFSKKKDSINSLKVIVSLVGHELIILTNTQIKKQKLNPFLCYLDCISIRVVSKLEPDPVVFGQVAVYTLHSLTYQ